MPAGAPARPIGIGSLLAIDARTLIRVLAVTRLLVGAALTVTPRRAASGWVGRSARKAPTQLLARALGVRDAAMGAGVLLTADDAAAARPWLAACVAADAIDCAANLAAREALPRRRAVGVALVAGASAVANGVLAKTLD